MAGVTGWFAELICDVEPATIIITGSTPNVVSTTDTHIFPEPAMLTVIGERPGVNGPPVSPLPAAITITGGTPSIGETLAPAGAAVTVTGSTPEIVQTANHLLQPTAGTVTVTGGTPTIVTGKILQPTGATATVTGGTPRLVSQVVPTGAAVTITGGRPLINVTYPPPTAQLTITGGRPLIHTTVVPTAATITVTGGTPLVTNNSLISFVSANSSTTGSVTIPTHQIGDLIVLCAFDSQNTAPTKPSAGGTVPNWNYIDNTNTSAGQAALTTAWFIATATNTTSGTWTWAEQMIAAVVTGPVGTTPIGGHAAVGGAGANVTAPSVTMTHTDGSSILLHFHATAFINGGGWSAAPTGYTHRVVAGPSSSRSLLLNTKDTTTSDGSVTQPDGSSGWAFAAATVEIVN
ncbi:hypothetical protein [Mycobacteroides chelonae]|uniref:hypothetical protein n=1 Tax=Mycobacteroides chelonae TaxID=1774 RepID=UPI0008A907FE|nr:hypothetical protein [Mycobacteroides chelonae]OHU48907.1 hypothetical protein BKG81_16005 [Mycobacteroides chelonae]